MTDLLEALPDGIKNADPATTPNYQERLTAAIGTALVAHRAARPVAAGIGINGRLGFNFVACAAALAGVVVQYWVPVAKVIKWIKEAHALWGSVNGILKACVDGCAAREIGPEAVKVLEGVLGVRGVVSHCL